MKNKKKILVCGGTGFIGRNIVEFFSKLNDYEVHATHYKRNKFSNNNIKWYKVDLRNKNQVNKIINNFEIVFQAAATTSGARDIVNKPYIHVTDNAVMNSYIFRAAHENNIKHLIFFSCTVMYHSSNINLKEKDFDPSKDLQKKYYGVGHTKLYIEKLCNFYSSFGKTKYSVIRHSNIYGPYDKFDFEKSHFFGASISKIMQNDKVINIWGKGTEKRDFLYVDDLMFFLEKLINYQKLNFKLYNCSYGKAFSINQIIKKMIKISGKKLKIEYDLSAPTITSNMKISSKLAEKELNWTPKTHIDKGIQKTISWWKKNIKNV